MSSNNNIRENKRKELIKNIMKKRDILANNQDASNKVDKINIFENLISNKFGHELSPRFIKNINKILFLEPTNIEEYKLKGLSYLLLDRYTEALFLFKKAHYLEPNNIDILRNIGNTYSLQGNSKEAILWYDKALKIDDNNFDTILNKLINLSKLGNVLTYDTSLLDKAHYLEPNNIDVLKIKANTYSLQGNSKEAILWYDKALKIDDKNIEILLLKAQTLIELNKKVNAKKICNSLAIRNDLGEDYFPELMNLYSKISDYDSIDKIFEKSSNIESKRVYIQIQKIYRESSIKEKQKMQKKLDDANRNSNYEKAIKDMGKNIIDEFNKTAKADGDRTREVVKEQGEKILVKTEKDKKEIKDTIKIDGDETRKLIINLFKSLNDDISTIKQNGKEALTGIQDLDQKMDKLSEISNEIYEETKKASEKLKSKESEKFDKKKKELMKRFGVPNE